MTPPRQPVDWRGRLILSLWSAALWGLILGTMVAARGVFHRVVPKIFEPGPAGWDFVRAPLGMFAIVFCAVFALGMAGVPVRFDARWLVRNKRVLWILWGVLLLVLVLMYIVIAAFA